MRLAPIVAALAFAWASSAPTPAAAQTRPSAERADAGAALVAPERATQPSTIEAPRGAVVASTAVDPRFAALPELTFRAINTRETVRARLYRADGTVDPAVVQQLSRLFRDTATGEASPVVVRTLQLIVKAATRFDAREVEVVSGYRTGRSSSGRRVRREGYHGVGSAIDFRLPGVDMELVAAYARTFSHVGVGYYPRLGFLHLDSREQTYFWVNAAGRSHHGWNRPLAREGVADRDRAWSTDADAPWDPPGVTIALDTHPRTAPGAHRPHRRHARRDRRHHRSRHHRSRGRLPLHVFSGGAR
jgi:uncharacterized protein YcbK (DUF882 family)